MKKISLTFWIFLLVLSCNKESDPEFSGISELDSSGILIGGYDKTDWRFDDIWNAQEESLFNNINFKSTQNFAFHKDYTSVNTISKSMAFPNPVKTVLALMIESSADSIKYVFVDKNYKILFSYKSINTYTHWNIDVSDRKKFKANSIYRIYYKLEYNNGDVEKGHGDIKIIN